MHLQGFPPPPPRLRSLSLSASPFPFRKLPRRSKLPDCLMPRHRPATATPTPRSHFRRTRCKAADDNDNDDDDDDDDGRGHGGLLAFLRGEDGLQSQTQLRQWKKSSVRLLSHSFTSRLRDKATPQQHEPDRKCAHRLTTAAASSSSSFFFS